MQVKTRFLISFLIQLICCSCLKADINFGFGDDGVVSDPTANVEFKTSNPNGGNTQLVCRIEGKWQYVTESGKPIFNIHHVTKDVIIVARPVGFVTPLGVYRLNKEKGSVDSLFESCDKRGSVDFKFVSFDEKEGKITLRAFENLSYMSTSRSPRLMEEVYVYLVAP
jgi:hypothetical protein